MYKVYADFFDQRLVLEYARRPSDKRLLKDIRKGMPKALTQDPDFGIWLIQQELTPSCLRLVSVKQIQAADVLSGTAR